MIEPVHRRPPFTTAGAARAWRVAAALLIAAGPAACVTTSERALVASADRVGWPFADTAFVLDDPVSGAALGSVRVDPGADGVPHRAVVRDPAGVPHDDFPEPIPFVLAGLPADAAGAAGYTAAWLVEWGAGAMPAACQLQSFLPLCGQALLVTVAGADGFRLRVPEAEQILAVPGAAAVVEMTGGGAGFMPFARMLMVRPGASAADLAALILAASPADDAAIATARGRPAAPR